MLPRCPICREVLTLRGNLPPRFCPRCGQRLGDPMVLAQIAPRGEGGKSSPAAITALFLGILGIIIPFGCLPFGIPAILVGAIASHNIHNASGELRGNGMAMAGMVLGIISMFLWPLIAVGR